MTSAVDSEAWPLRMGVQLRALGELTETLTLRLLEMERRLLHLEDQQSRLLDRAGRDGADAAAVLDLLEQTDDRLSRLEALLDQPAHGQISGVRPLRVLDSATPPPASAPEPEFGGETLFPEEGEQPFMDELRA
ncbi:hypothetical protein KQ304_11130 [Synechococcus sp. CS-1329]|uniref:hypothetical protein n=1 Tax=Synechococcus sp. CS-1329 TaxID=2847975 RepID=UPI00223B432B|nr:hypothetical protein [Synechococcus sp. CS-1329]MCT0219539.1 hypothetical protein [Synechococcus sp. CS-1329]